VKKILKVLTQFVELVTDHYFANRFIIAPDAIPTIISLISHSSTKVRQTATLVLETATKNNQPVQERVLGSNVLEIYYVRLQVAGSVVDLNLVETVFFIFNHMEKICRVCGSPATQHCSQCKLIVWRSLSARPLYSVLHLTLKYKSYERQE
jgi:hypothetical protein